MRLLLLLLVVLAGGVAIALTARQDPGYVLLSYHGWTVETSIIFLGASLIALFLLIYLATRLLVGTLRAPRRLARWHVRRREAHAQDALMKGLLALAEARWQRAEKFLTRYIRYSKFPVLNYLGAARAAQRRGAIQRRDDYMRLADNARPSAGLAVGVTQAELQLDRHELEQALATLMDLRQRWPKHRHVMNLLLRLYIKLGEWESLLDLLPRLRASGLVGSEEQRELEIKAYGRLLATELAARGLEGLRGSWNALPRRLQHDQTLTLEYAYYLMTHGEGSEAEDLLAKTIKRRWDDELVYLYGLIHGPNLAEQLSRAEKWLSTHSKNAILLLTLGRLCIRNELWGKARQYLESSLAISRHAETYRELGLLLERMGKTEAALDCYKKGLLSQSNKITTLGSLGRGGVIEPVPTRTASATP